VTHAPTLIKATAVISALFSGKAGLTPRCIPLRRSRADTVLLT